MKRSLVVIVAVLVSVILSMAAPEQKTVGSISIPPGVTMRSYSTSEPNYLKGNYVVRITALPESKMRVIQYVWIEDMQKGLKTTVDKLNATPAVIFDDVSEADAKRMVGNLKQLGCSAEFAAKK